MPTASATRTQEQVKGMIDTELASWIAFIGLLFACISPPFVYFLIKWKRPTVRELARQAVETASIDEPIGVRLDGQKIELHPDGTLKRLPDHIRPKRAVPVFNPDGTLHALMIELAERKIPEWAHEYDPFENHPENR